MEINPYISTRQIVNLRNFRGPDSPLFRQHEKIMKNGFLDTSTEEFGYYDIRYKENVTSGYSAWFYLHAFTVGIPILFGVPTDQSAYYLTSFLDIYDSNGNLVKTYSESISSDVNVGLYYPNEQKNATPKVQKMFVKLLKNVNKDSAVINQALRSAGPITQEKDSRTRIAIAKVAGEQYNRNDTYVSPAPIDTSSWTQPTGTQPSSNLSNQPSAQNSAALALQTGRYAAANNTNISVSINAGLVTLYEGTSAVGNGSYKINGNQIVITYFQASGAWSGHSGKTWAFTITSSTSFSGNGETWIYRGMM
jgi:hypothetical protein